MLILKAKKPNCSGIVLLIGLLSLTVSSFASAQRQILPGNICRPESSGQFTYSDGQIKNTGSHSRYIQCPIASLPDYTDIDFVQVFYHDGNPSRSVSCAFEMCVPQGTKVYSESASSGDAFIGSDELGFTVDFNFGRWTTMQYLRCRLPGYDPSLKGSDYSSIKTILVEY